MGIGTIYPNQPLSIQASTASNSPLLGFYSAAGADKFNFSLADGGLNLSESGVATGRLFVQLGGNVGIGTSNPGQKLEVAGQVYSSTGGFRFPDGSVQTTAATTSTNAVLNQTSQQTASFNVSGTGTVGGLLTAGSATVGGNVGIGTTAAAPATQKLDVRGNVRLGANGGNVAGTGQAIEFVGPGFSTDPVGLYRINTAADASELRVVVGDVPDANDKFVVGRQPGTNAEGGIPGGTFTPTFTVRADGNVGVGTDTPTSTFQVNGSVAASIRTLSSGTVATTDYTVLVGGNLSLPTPAASNAGRLYNLLTTGGSYVVTAAFRDAGGTFATYGLNNSPGARGIVVQSDGTNWWIVSRQ